MWNEKNELGQAEGNRLFGFLVSKKQRMLTARAPYVGGNLDDVCGAPWRFAHARFPAPLVPILRPWSTALRMARWCCCCCCCWMATEVPDASNARRLSERV